MSVSSHENKGGYFCFLVMCSNMTHTRGKADQRDPHLYRMYMRKIATVDEIVHDCHVSEQSERSINGASVNVARIVRCCGKDLFLYRCTPGWFRGMCDTGHLRPMRSTTKCFLFFDLPTCHGDRLHTLTLEFTLSRWPAWWSVRLYFRVVECPGCIMCVSVGKSAWYPTTRPIYGNARSEQPGSQSATE